MDNTTHPIDRIGLCAEQIKYLASALTGRLEPDPDEADPAEHEAFTFAMLIVEKAEQINKDVSEEIEQVRAEIDKAKKGAQ